EHPRRIALAAVIHRATTLQSAPQHRCSFTFLGGKKPVFRRKGEPIFLPYGGAGDDLHVYREVSNHPLDHHYFLSVLATEEGKLRPHDVEQLAHHRCYAAKEFGAAGAFQLVAEAFHDYIAGESILIDVGRYRRKDQINTSSKRQLRVVREIARVFVELVVRRELHRVHEGRDHYDVAHLACAGHQGHVTLVNGAHCGDKANLTTLSSKIPRDGHHSGDSIDYLHTC